MLGESASKRARRSVPFAVVTTAGAVLTVLLTSTQQVSIPAAMPIGVLAAMLSVLTGAVLMTLISWSLTRLTRGSLGRGDTHYSPILGALIGWAAPWPDLPSTLLTAWILTILSAALASVIGLLSRRLIRTSTIPYGPFMTLGTVVAVAMTLGAAT